MNYSIARINKTEMNRAIKCLNEHGHKGYHKDIALRVDLDTGLESYNDYLTRRTQNDDLADIHAMRGTAIDVEYDPTDPLISFDIWLYRNDPTWGRELDHHATVWAIAIRGKIMGWYYDKPEHGEVMRKAVEAETSRQRIKEINRQRKQ